MKNISVLFLIAISLSLHAQRRLLVNGNRNAALSIDADAQAYFDALSISGNLTLTDASTLTPTQVLAAINRHIQDLKGVSNGSYTTYNIWSKLAVIKPYIGGTSAQHAVNAKSPGTYNSTFGGSLTHDAYGVLHNGTTYEDSGFPMNTLTNNDFAVGAYMSNNTTSTGLLFGIGSATGNGNSRIELYAKYTDNVTYYQASSNTEQATSANTIANTIGMYIVTSYNNGTNNRARLTYNGSQLGDVADTKVALLSLNMYYGGGNFLTGGAGSQSASRIPYSFIASTHLTAAEEAAYYNSILALETTLKRQ